MCVEFIVAPIFEATCEKTFSATSLRRHLFGSVSLAVSVRQQVVIVLSFLGLTIDLSSAASLRPCFVGSVSLAMSFPQLACIFNKFGEKQSKYLSKRTCKTFLGWESSCALQSILVLIGVLYLLGLQKKKAPLEGDIKFCHELRVSTS